MRKAEGSSRDQWEVSRYPYPDTPLGRAKQEVLSRMHGCGEEDCYACRTNREAIEDMENAVRDVMESELA